MKTYLIVISLSLLSLSGCAPNSTAGGEYLDLALQTEEWLNQNSISINDHRVWPDAIDEPDKTTLSYSDGMAGKLTYYLELYEATDNGTYLDRAKDIGDYLLENLPQKTDSLKGKFWAFSPYGEVCGPGFALTVLFKATGKDKYREAALEIVDLVAHFADNPKDTISWDLGNDVLGGLSGTGLYLLYMAKEFNSLEALNMAKRAGKTLIDRAKKETNGLSWRRGQNGKYILPNFSHGPAGIGYFMASLYETTGDIDFLNTAYQVVEYLDSVANTEEGVYLIPYGFPNPGWRRDFDIGWAHGPAGVARLFIKLHQITGEQLWLNKAEACYRGILKSNYLGAPSAGFGTESFTLDQRFGLAGVGAFLQDLYSYTGKREYLEQATLTIEYILSKSVSDQGLSWPIERFGFMSNAGDTTTFTGFFYGTTGFGSLLLNQYNILEGNSKVFRFVDDPFD